MQGGVELCLHSRGFPGKTLHDRPLGACDLSTPSLVFREAWVWVRWTVSLAAAVGQGRPASPQRKTGKGPKSAEAGVSRDSPAPTAGQFFLLGGSATHPLQSASLFFITFLSKYDFRLTKSLQGQYKEFPHTLHLDSPNVNTLSHLPYSFPFLSR